MFNIYYVYKNYHNICLSHMFHYQVGDADEEEDDDDEDEGVDNVDDDGYTRQCNKRTTYIWV